MNRLSKSLIVRWLFIGILVHISCSSFAQADTVWTRTYTGPNSLFEQAQSVITDDSGNIFVAGITTVDGTDILLIKYNASGDSLWTSRFSGTQVGADDFFLSMVKSDSGFIYIACWSYYVPASYIAFNVIKYSPDGNRIWTRQITGVQGESNGKPSKRLAVDHNGNVYFTGTKNFNFYTMKLSASGDSIWTATYGDAGYTYDDPTSLALDLNNNVFVTGKQWLNGSYDFCTIKYNTNGQQQWVSIYDGPGHNTDYPYALMTDSAGNCYVTGSSFVSNAVNTGFCTIKYNPDGDTLWVRRYDGVPSFFNEPYILVMDHAGNVYAGGNSNLGSPSTGGTGTDFCVIRYSPSGFEQQIYRYNGLGNDEDKLYDFTIDSFGNLFLAGKSNTGDVTYNDFCLVKFNSTGTKLWETFFGNGSGDADQAYAVTTWGTDEIIAAGSVSARFFTVKYHDVLSYVDENNSLLNNEELLQAFPNPFSNNFIVKFYADQPDRFVITLSDIYGKEVFKENTGVVGEGTHYYLLSSLNIPSGIYLMQLQNQSGYTVQMKVVSR